MAVIFTGDDAPGQDRAAQGVLRAVRHHDGGASHSLQGGAVHACQGHHGTGSGNTDGLSRHHRGIGVGDDIAARPGDLQNAVFIGIAAVGLHRQRAGLKDRPDLHGGIRHDKAGEGGFRVIYGHVAADGLPADKAAARVGCGAQDHDFSRRRHGPVSLSHAAGCGRHSDRQQGLTAVGADLRPVLVAAIGPDGIDNGVRNDPMAHGIGMEIQIQRLHGGIAQVLPGGLEGPVHVGNGITAGDGVGFDDGVELLRAVADTHGHDLIDPGEEPVGIVLGGEDDPGGAVDVPDVGHNAALAVHVALIIRQGVQEGLGPGKGADHAHGGHLEGLRRQALMGPGEGGQNIVSGVGRAIGGVVLLGDARIQGVHQVVAAAGDGDELRVGDGPVQAAAPQQGQDIRRRAAVRRRVGQVIAQLRRHPVCKAFAGGRAQAVACGDAVTQGQVVRRIRRQGSQRHDAGAQRQTQQQAQNSSFHREPPYFFVAMKVISTLHSPAMRTSPKQTRAGSLDRLKCLTYSAFMASLYSHLDSRTSMRTT